MKFQPCDLSAEDRGRLQNAGAIARPLSRQRRESLSSFVDALSRRRSISALENGATAENQIICQRLILGPPPSSQAKQRLWLGDQSHDAFFRRCISLFAHAAAVCLAFARLSERARTLHPQARIWIDAAGCRSRGGQRDVLGVRAETGEHASRGRAKEKVKERKLAREMEQKMAAAEGDWEPLDLHRSK
ncbi:hypothetical protein MTO96_011571 [Rhipicephalus appendiculatus]